MGGVLYTRVIETDYSVLERLKGHLIIAADMGGRNIFEDKIKTDKPIALCIGSEADGISERIKNAAQELVSVPMRNVESLNAAVAAGILIYSVLCKSANPSA